MRFFHLPEMALISGPTSFNCVNPHRLNVFFILIDNSQTTEAEPIHVFQFTFQFLNVIMIPGIF